LIEQQDNDLFKSIDTKALTPVIEDTYTYLVTDNSKLPIINIAALKQTLIDTFTAQIMTSNPTIEQEIIKLTNELKKVPGGLVNGTLVNQKVITTFTNSSLNKELQLSVIDITNIIIYINSNNNSKDIANYIVSKMISSQLKLDTVSDTLDLNILLDNTFKDKNPITYIKTNALNIKTSIVISMIAITTLIIGLILLVAYNIKKTAKWIIIPTVISIIPSISLIAFYIVNKHILSELIIKSKLEIFDKFITNYIGNMNIYMIIQTVLIVILLTALYIFSKLYKQKEIVNRHLVIRSFSYIGGSLIILLIIAYNIYNTYTRINNIITFKTPEININQALDKTLNTDLFESLGNQKQQ